MPLHSGTSEEVFKENVREMIASGHERSQAVAAAYSEKRKSAKDNETAREVDSNGFIEIKNNPISRVGVFPYSGAQIDSSLEPNRIYQVYRPAEELSSPECIESFRLVPWVDLHPNRLLGPESEGRMPAEQKGIEGTTGEDVYFKDGILYANIKIYSENLKEKIEEYGIRELSLGYGCIYEISSGEFEGKHYDAIQRNIRGNHIASVPEGRMGPEIAVLDKLTFTFDAKEIKMAKTKEEETEANLKNAADRAAKDGYSKYMAADEEDPEEKAMRKKAGALDDFMDDDKKKSAKDEDEDKKKGDSERPASDKKAKDEDSDESANEKNDEQTKKDEKKARAGLDAADLKVIFAEVKKRDELAGKLSGFVGAFDASEMTTAEVAKYGVSKLGIACDVGQEMAALTGFMHGRTAPVDEVGYALDTASKTTSDFDSLFNQESK